MKWVTVTTGKALVTITQRGVMFDLIIYTLRNTGSLSTVAIIVAVQNRYRGST